MPTLSDPCIAVIEWNNTTNHSSVHSSRFFKILINGIIFLFLCFFYFQIYNMGGNNITELDDQILNDYERSPVVFMISLICFLSSNLFAFMIRIFKNSIPLVNMNIIILINYSIAELYNIFVTVLVCYFYKNLF